MKPPTLQTQYVDGWKSGMDTRAGLFADAFKTFRELTNCVISVNGNVITRPPAVTHNVTLDSQAQGWMYNNGVWYTFARKGATVTHTGTNASSVVTLYWDPPEYTTTSWELIGHFVYRGSPAAVITHTYQGTTITQKTCIHIWDSKAGQPTYVLDPYAPQSWSLGTWPLWAYSSAASSIGAFTGYTPTWAMGAEKIIVSRPDGNPAYSAIGRGRVWNTRSVDDIEQTGAMYYVTMPTTSPAVFVFPEVYTELATTTSYVYSDPKFAAYTCEKLNANGTWTKLTQTTGTPAAGQFALAAGSATWNASATQLTIAESVDTIVRLRCLVTPEVRLVTGGSYTPSNLKITGDGVTTDFNMGVPYIGFSSTYTAKIGSTTKDCFSVSDSGGTAIVQFDRFNTILATGSNAAVRASSAAVVAGGAGYAVNDLIDVVGTGGGPNNVLLRLKVATVAAGAITSLTINTATESYLTTPSGTLTTTTITGVGAGATVSITWSTNVAAALVGLHYSGVSDTTNFDTALSLDGTSFTTVTYQAGVTAAQTWVLWNTPAADNGKTLNGSITLKSAKVMTFDASANLIAGGQVSYEGALYSFNASARTSAPAVASYVGVQVAGGTASVVYQTAATDFYETRYNTIILGYRAADGTWTPYKYAYQSNTTWYSTRHLDNTTYWAGTGEAGYINSQSRNGRGELITSMLSAKNRLLICYEHSTQLWAFDPDPNANSYMDRYDFGTTGPLAQFYDVVLMDTQRAPRLFELTGFNYQALSDSNVGETLTDVGKVEFTSTAFWPWFGGFVAFGSLTDSNVYADRAKLFMDSVLRTTGTQWGFWILSFSKESQTAAWSWNPVPGVTTVKRWGITPVDERFYFVTQDNEVYYLLGTVNGDADTGYFVDDTTGDAVVSRATTHYSHMGQPGTTKRLISIDVAKDGPLQISANFTPWGAQPNAEWGPIITDATIGTPRIPMTGSGSACSLDIQCSDQEGFELQMIDLKYVQGGRQ